MVVHFRATNENNYLLREKVIGLEAKLGRAEKKLTDISRLQVEKEVRIKSIIIVVGWRQVVGTAG